MESSRLPDNDAAQRSALYGLLSRSFLREPDAELLHYFRSRDVQEVFKELDLTLPEDFMSRKEETLVHELALEYARLFLTPPAHLPPYESCYVGGLDDPEELFEPRLQGKAAKEVQLFYREHGMVVPQDTKLLPDHIGIELEALRLLAELESRATASDQHDQVQHLRRLTGKFISEHPNRWFQAFCDQIQQRTDAAFYRVIAELTQSFIESELEELRPFCLEEEEVTL